MLISQENNNLYILGAHIYNSGIMKDINIFSRSLQVWNGSKIHNRVKPVYINIPL